MGSLLRVLLSSRLFTCKGPYSAQLTLKPKPETVPPMCGFLVSLPNAAGRWPHMQCQLHAVDAPNLADLTYPKRGKLCYAMAHSGSCRFLSVAFRKPSTCSVEASTHFPVLFQLVFPHVFYISMSRQGNP